MYKQLKYDILYMDIAKRVSEMSYANRKKVGCVVVKDDNIISYGWNGTPKGFDNICEIESFCECCYDTNKYLECNICNNARTIITTKQEVLHAELNAISKLASTSNNSNGATIYVTLHPCIECAKLIIQSKITRVVYDEEYRLSAGVELLKRANIDIVKLKV